ncbi:Diphthamide biosynthesis protein 2 [Intoshia linei]|uniref:Diphthamide biosynthesis protein 2 n=1 Tax=Intoshia linei TaxID=1819745 RepID=A0A177B2B1_9BILA|nr:Diphthamide biosynthesis protein 2 [Intoshia linei]
MLSEIKIFPHLSDIEFKAYFFTVLSSFIFFTGWMFAIGFAYYYPYEHEFPKASQILGVSSTIGMILINICDLTVLTNSYAISDSFLSHRATQFIFFIGCVLCLSSLIGSLWFFVQNYILSDLFIGPGIAIVVQNVFIILGYLFMYSKDSDLLKNVKLNEKSSELFEINVNVFFDLEKCLEWIKNNKLKKVGIQLNQLAIKYSLQIYEKLKFEQVEIYVICDSIFKGCCTDYISAEHVPCDGIIQFGKACLTCKNEIIPTLNIFGKVPFLNDIQNLLKYIPKFVDENECILLYIDVDIYHLLDDFTIQLLKLFKKVYPMKISKDDTILGRHVSLENMKDSGGVLYIGEDIETLYSVSLYFSTKQIAYLNMNPPETTDLNSTDDFNYQNINYIDFEVSICGTVNTSNLISKRYFVIDKCKSAKFIGIMIGNLHTIDTLKYVQSLKRLLKLCGKSVYIIYTGRPNIPKCANFVDIEVFVYLSCFSSFIYNSKEFIAPIASLHELLLSCIPSDTVDIGWNSFICMDIQSIDIHLYEKYINVANNDSDDELEVKKEKSLIFQKNYMIKANETAASLLANKHFSGLDPNFEKSEPAVLSEGKCGCASLYENDISLLNNSK